METTLNRLISLNLELEGLLRVAAARPSGQALEAARARFGQMQALFDSLTAAQAVKEYDQQQTELKYEEVEGVEESPLDEPSEASIPDGAVIVESDTEAVASSQPKTEPKTERTDLRRMLTLNDKFLFRRELFGGNDAEFSDTLDLIDSMHSFDEASEYLLHDLQWDPERPVVKDFLTLVDAHFKY